MSSSKPLFISRVLAGAALSISSVPAMANPACGLSLQGCVLPAQDVATPGFPTQEPVAGPAVVEGPKGFPWLALLGLAAAAVLAYGLLTDNDSNAVPASP